MSLRQNFGNFREVNHVHFTVDEDANLFGMMLLVYRTVEGVNKALEELGKRHQTKAIS